MSQSNPVRDALSRVLYPALLALPLTAFGWLWLRNAWDPSIALQAVYWSNFLFLLLVERTMPFDRAWTRNDGQIPNDFFYSLTAVIVNSLATVVCLWILFALIKAAGGLLSFNVWPTQWPFALQVIVGIAIWDLGNHLAHRWAHKVGILWRFHAVHHAAPRLSVVNTGRLHPIDVIKSVAIGAPIPVLLGVPDEVSMWYAAFNVFTGQLTHSNVDVKCGVFNWFLSTPNLHRWHHSPYRQETDTNFGEATVIWDRMFGTYFNPDRPPRRNVGLGREVPVSRRLWESLLQPFTPAGHHASEANLIAQLPAGDAGPEVHADPQQSVVRI